MRTEIYTNKASAPAAGYAQAIAFGQFVFVSGQVASIPETGAPFSMEDQVAQILSSIEEIVKAAGGNRESIMRCGVFLSDLTDFTEMDRAYRQFFGTSLPARTTVQACLGAYRVEIDAIAVRTE